MNKKLSMKAKVLAGVTAIAAVGLVAVLVVALAAGGKTLPPSGDDLIPDASPDAAVSASQEPDATPQPPSPSPSAAPAAEASPTQAATASPAPKTETSYAYITGWAERSAPDETRFAFDYVDWLTGEEAITKYMQDHGCSKEDAINETEEYGYIRNVNPLIRWFVTTKDTVYYLPDATSVKAVKVNYTTFLNKMIPAIDSKDLYLTFVKVTVSGESIVKIEWVYHP